MTEQPYTSTEHSANLERWMDLSDRDRSEAFYMLYALCGARAQNGDEHVAGELRELLSKAAGDHHSRVNGKCSWCGEPMPVPERPQGGGRTKLYCSPAHKQAAHRAGDFLPTTTQ